MHIRAELANCTSALEYALAYSELRWYVYQVHSIRDDACTCGNPSCSDPAKHPLKATAEHGFNSATLDPDLIREWWTRNPWANVGIATGPSDLVVVDVDPKNGGNATYDDLVRRYGALPATHHVRTGGGGDHYYLSAGGVFYESTGGVLGTGIDIRAQKGGVVAPPSLHRSGQLYQWS